MNLSIDTMICLTDDHTVGLYTSADSFECPIEERAIVDMVEEYCNLFVLPDEPYVISSDCYDLVGDLRVELLRALDMVDRYVDATAQEILSILEPRDGI